MSEKDRLEMEKRHGPLGSGATHLTVEGKAYDLYDLLKMLGLDYDDVRPIDAQRLDAEGLFAIRYFDLEERMVVAHEFDAAFGYVREQRVHIAEWMGEEAYQNFGWGAWCPANPDSFGL
ncbi:MAG: hypothetical protein HY575_07320 [candidate division NC10 bacterium]|nr:hypothetical protein [candidate division NC10 bacterium]